MVSRMPDKVDYYSLLHVAPSADIELIRAVYRVLAKRYHPDCVTHSSPESLAQFRLIQKAFDVLSDPRARVEYDGVRAKNVGDFPQTSRGQLTPEKIHRDPSLWAAVVVMAAFVLFVLFQMRP
jgi:curved DNA-binding protein CbpA